MSFKSYCRLKYFPLLTKFHQPELIDHKWNSYYDEQASESSEPAKESRVSGL